MKPLQDNTLLRAEDTQVNSDMLRMLETELYTAVLSDALDELGFRYQAMREYLRPVQDRKSTL